MFQNFPSLHPLAIHFPIVLILLAAALQTAVVFKPNWLQVRWITLIIMAGAFFSALAASTLFHAEPSADAPAAAMEVFEEHEKYAQLTLWTSGITFLLKAIGIFFKINKRSYNLLVLAAAIAAAVFLSIAGHHGANLTHIQGVGPMGKYLMKGHGMEGEMDNMKDMNTDTAMNMTDTMPGMRNMKGMDSMNMSTKKAMNNMPGMQMDSGMNMENMRDMNKMHDMKNMAGMGKMKDMNNMPDMIMDSSKNMKDMSKMPGMTMDSSMNMKDMNNMPGMNMDNMGNMSMPMKNPMDTLRFPDNNPARKKTKKIKP